MAEYILTVIDTAGVQDYIFATNNLRQNAGASFLADCATRSWVKEVLDTVAAGAHNVIDLDAKEDKFDGRTIEKDHLQAELIYAGGGNTVLLFDLPERAKTFTQTLTHKVMLSAPGLRLMIHHSKPFDWRNHILAGADGVMMQTFKEMQKRKRKATPSYPLLGLGVSSRCVFTGLPAVGYDKDERPVAAIALAKEQQEFDKEAPDNPATAYGRLCKLIDFHGYIPARDFDNLGITPNESSLIAVTHADGNSMGKRIEAIRDDPASQDNRIYLEKLRAFSASVEKASLSALQVMVDLLVANIHTKQTEEGATYYIPASPGIYDLEGSIVLQWNKEAQKFILPLRPIVIGGDDTTFVCEGRLGLVLAHYYLQAFSSQKLSDKKFAHCRAGVALVPLHFPFARAYALADDLCKSAKGSIQIWKSKNAQDHQNGVTALDWHFAIGGMVQDDLKEVRKREYTSDDALEIENRIGDLLMRPLRIDPADDEWRTWPIFLATLRDFKSGNQWRNRHNKAKALRYALRKGGKAVEQFRWSYTVQQLPEIPYRPEMQAKGWHGAECGYFDAIEAMDRFIELDSNRVLAQSTQEQEAV
jgi:hypothetical protein